MPRSQVAAYVFGAFAVLGLFAAWWSVPQASAAAERAASLSPKALQEVITEAIEPLTIGTAIRNGHSAVVADPRANFAFYVDPDGQITELPFRLDRRAPALAIPPEGYVLVRDIREQVFVVRHNGEWREVFDE